MRYTKARALLALLLILVTLIGCTNPLGRPSPSPMPTQESTVTPTPVPTPEPLGAYVPQPAWRADVSLQTLIYARPDVDAYIAKVEEFLPRFAAAKTPKEQLILYLEMEAYSQNVSDMALLAEIQFMQNVTPETQAEKDYCSEFSASIQEYNISIYQALLSSPYVEQFRRYFGEEVLSDMQRAVDQYDPAIVELMEQVEKLGSEYTRVAKEHAENPIEFKGREMPVGEALGELAYGLTPGSSDYKRLESAIASYYDTLNEQCDPIYTEIISLLNQAADLTGYESYPAYALQGGSYSLEEIRMFIQDVRATYIPLLDDMLAQGEGILNMPLTPMLYYIALCPPMLEVDYAYLSSQEGAGELDAEQSQLAAAEQILRALLPEAGELMDYLTQTDMLDVMAAPGKSAGAFSAFFYGIGQPFIYADEAVATTILHEAGHALNSYSLPLMDISERYASGTEVREVHSMGLEVLSYQQYEILYGESAEYAIYAHLFEGLITILTQTMYYEFELTCYEQPELTREERNALYARLTGEYGLAIPGLSLYTRDGYTWVDTLHFFQSPLYTIDYTLAQSAAYQIFEIQSEDPAQAKEVYMEFLLDNQTLDLRERLANAGLDDVFDQRNMQDLAGRLRELFLSEEYTRPLTDLMRGLNAA